MTESRAARWYQERAGLVATNRAPLPRAAPGENRIHSLALRSPLPQARLLQPLVGNNPDHGSTTIWPQPESQEVADE